MSLLAKSKQNEKAVICLKNFDLFAPAVHCCYYACFQKITYILKEYFPDQYLNVSHQKKDSHVSLLSEFKSCYQSNIDKNNALVINRRIRELKTLRKRSDYGNDLISKEMMEKAEDYAKEILSILKKDTHI